jgi:hypothetical protein
VQRPTAHSSWQELVASPRRPSHLLQIYDSDAFLASGVGLFAAEGLSRGEAVRLTGTRAHLRDVQAVLSAHGVAVDAALASGQLISADVDQALGAIMVDGMPDAGRFRACLGDAFAAAGDDARLNGVRWWGEMSPVLQRAGNLRAALRAEELAGEAAAAHDCVVFCSYLVDRFDAHAYDGMLHEVCACHSHVIPAEDYVSHRQAVNRAIADVIGDIKGAMLQSLLSWQGLGCELPSSQALLFWLRDTAPERFHEVLSRARSYHLAEAAR